MTQPLTDQRARNDLIAELYDRHATGLFAYCADQLGDPGTAGYALVAVLSSVPADPPPRAALYALARREIHRRDIVYAPPVVDPLVDPASALVERTLRELRPHQREVLLLCEVCNLSHAELAWVLDVAPDTAEELAVSAAHRFRQALGTALAFTGPRVPADVADVYGALTVAPLRDVLCRLPWPAPPPSLRVHVAGSRTAAAAPLFVKPLWPAPPRWPQPLSLADPTTATGIFPTELLTPPSRAADHEATTAPMPRLRDGLPPMGGSSGDGLLFSRDGLSTGSRDGLSTESRDGLPTGSRDGRPAGGRARGDLSTGRRSRGSSGRRSRSGSPAGGLSRDGSPSGGPSRDGSLSRTGMPRAGMPLSAPVPADVLDDPPTEELPAIAPELPAPGDVLVHSARSAVPPAGATAPGSLFRPHRPVGEPVYRMPLPAPEATPAPEPPAYEPSVPERSAFEPPTPRTSAFAPSTPAFEPSTPVTAGAARRKAAGPVRTRKAPARKPRKAQSNRHHDWAWEVAGFLICVLIAMIVFFSVPVIGSP